MSDENFDPMKTSHIATTIRTIKKKEDSKKAMLFGTIGVLLAVSAFVAFLFWK